MGCRKTKNRWCTEFARWGLAALLPARQGWERRCYSKFGKIVWGCCKIKINGGTARCRCRLIFSSKCITHISSSRPKVMGWLKGRVLIPTGAQLFCYSEIPNSCLCLLNCLIKQNSNSGFHCLGRVKCGFMFQPFWPTVPGWRTESLTLTLYESDQDARLIPNLTPGFQFQYPY